MPRNDTRCTTNAKAAARGREIRQEMGRGSATGDKIQTTLNDMRGALDRAGADPLRKVDQITQDQVDTYMRDLVERHQAGDLGAKAVKDRVTALNNLVRSSLVNKPDLVQSAKALGVSARVDTSDKANSREAAEAFKKFLDDKAAAGDKFAQPLKLAVQNQLENGLRFQESACMRFPQKNPNSDFLAVAPKDNPKNNRPREVELRHQSQRDAIQAARDYCRKNDQVALIPPGKNLDQFRAAADQLRAEFAEKTGMNFKFHGERHEFAHRLYADKTQQLCGVPLKCKAQVCEERLSADKITDPRARQKCYNEYITEQTGLKGFKAKMLVEKAFNAVSDNLGHGDGRADITRAYLG